MTKKWQQGIFLSICFKTFLQRRETQKPSGCFTQVTQPTPWSSSSSSSWRSSSSSSSWWSSSSSSWWSSSSSSSWWSWSDATRRASPTWASISPTWHSLMRVILDNYHQHPSNIIIVNITSDLVFVIIIRIIRIIVIMVTTAIVNCIIQVPLSFPSH